MPQGNPNISLFSSMSSVIRSVASETPASKVSARKLEMITSSILSNGLGATVGTNGLIGTNGIGTTVSVGPQPLPPGLVGINGLIGENGYIMNPLSPDTAQYKIQSRVIGRDASNNPITANLMRRISLSPGGHYWEQYWFSHTYGGKFVSIYHLVISPEYTANTIFMESCDNYGMTYKSPAMCIKMSDKELYRHLWDETENAKFVFFPKPDDWATPTSVGVITIAGFDAV